MLTFSLLLATESADPRKQGRVTWLRELNDAGRPLVGNLSCPVSDIPTSLSGKDWTRYEGLLHTDHAVREEFFQDREVAPTSSKPYLMDFTYLYDDSQPDFQDFSLGKPFSEEEVFNDIGRPEEWTHRSRAETRLRNNEQAATVLEQL